MASGKKKGKGKTVSLNEFLGNENAPNYVKSSTSWADEMEEEDAEPDQAYAASLIDRSALPTAPRAARGANIDMSKVPTAPPFTAFLGNLPFEVSVEDIQRFFQKLEVTNVRLIEEGGRAKGYGYAEFADRQSLIEALSMDETTMRNRPIRVNLAEGRQGDREDRGRRKFDDFDDRTGDDWRRKPAGSQQDDFDDRRGSRDGGRYGDRDRRDDRYGDDRGRRDRYGDRDGRYGDRDSGRYGDRDSGRYGGGGRGRYDDREDSGPWRRGDSGSRDRYGDSYGGGGYDDGYGERRQYGRRDRNDRYGGQRDRDGGGRSFGSGYRDDRRRYSPPRDRYGSRDDGYGRRDQDGYGRRDDYRDRDERQKERPKLQLQKRTKPLEEASQDPEARPSSIFGSAKPVDTLSKELEIEQKLMSQHPEPSSESRSASIFGSAKPVDTAAREREIETRMRDKETIKPSDADDRRYEKGTGRRKDEERGKPRRDSGSPEGRRERRIPSSSSSTKGPRRVKRDSLPEADDDAPPAEERPAPTTPTSPPTPKEETKLVPAPLPKENVWAKRKEQASQQTSPSAQSTPASPPPASPSQVEDKKEESKQSEPSAESPPKQVIKENTAPGGPPSKTEFIPAKPPSENPWAKRAQQKSEQSTKADESRPDSSRGEEMSQGRGDSRDPGRGDSRDSGRPNAWARGAPRGRGGGTPRGRGGYRGDPPKKHREEKPLPKSIDEMPKYEEKKAKDLSDANKFSLLLDEEGGSSGGD